MIDKNKIVQLQTVHYEDNRNVDILLLRTTHFWNNLH
jgi:hypothetical protein